MAKISKTKDTLIDVARQMFAKLGFEGTTMYDIAVNSNKGRRTLYSYFKSKEEIYSAVIDNELNQMTSALTRVSLKNIDPQSKLEELIMTRMETIKSIVFRNGTLRADFFRDIWEVEKVRKQYDDFEIKLIKDTLDEGIRIGTFRVLDTELTAEIIHHTMKGMEVPYIRGQISNKYKRIANVKGEILNIFFKGLLNR